MIRKNYFFLLTLSTVFLFKGQVGINTTSPQAALDVYSQNQGILVPRVELTSTILTAPIFNPQSENLVNGTLIFNTATAGVSPNNVTPGFYYWKDSVWIAIKGSAAGTLNAAYNSSGAGMGRVITADSGPLLINGTDGLHITGNLNQGFTVPNLNLGSHLFFNPNKAAFRAGYVNSNQWNNDFLGRYSFATGINTKATGEGAVAMGYLSIASGTNSTALGESTTASGTNSFAIGSFSGSFGNNSSGIGEFTNARGRNSLASGHFSSATGDYSTAMGNNTRASGHSSSSMGNFTTASGQSSIAMGLATIASDNYTTTMGTGTQALGNFSTAMGESTIASSRSQVTTGRFNTLHTPVLGTDSWFLLDPLFVVGNGVSDENRSDALVIKKDGSLTISSPLAYKPGGGNWIATSDIRFKSDLKNYNDGLAKILEINPVTYHYNKLSGHDISKEHIGVIAQDLQKTAPYMVGRFQKDGAEYLNVDNSAMTYMLINAVKEQQAMINRQNIRIESLKKRFKLCRTNNTIN